MEHSDPSAGEFEKDCSKVQRKISNFLQQTGSFHAPSVKHSRHTFKKYLIDLTVKLTEGRSKRRERKEKSDLDTSVSESTPRPSRGSKLRLDLPDFSGHPLDWHHFHELFTSALERTGDDFFDREKACFLLKAMKTTEAEQIVKSHATAEGGYKKAFKALFQRFGSAKKVYPHLVHRMTAKESISFSKQGFVRFRENYLLTIQSMRELGCEDIAQFAASL